MKPSQKMWRTLVRVDEVVPEVRFVSMAGVWVFVPGYTTENHVWVPFEAIPPAIYANMENGKRYHVRCNIGAEHISELCFDGWEDDKNPENSTTMETKMGKKSKPNGEKG